MALLKVWIDRARFNRIESKVNEWVNSHLDKPVPYKEPIVNTKRRKIIVESTSNVPGSTIKVAVHVKRKVGKKYYWVYDKYELASGTMFHVRNGKYPYQWDTNN